MVRSTPRSRGQGRASPFPLSLRVEKNVICALLGRRTIKTLVRKTAGKYGARLVDLIYKLVRKTLGKSEARKLMKATLNVIAEVSVLTMHSKLSAHHLSLIRSTILLPLTKFKNLQAQRPNFTPYNLPAIRKEFYKSVRRAEKELLALLQPYCQSKTLLRLHEVGKMLRGPQIMAACFVQGESRVGQLITKLIATAGFFEEEQKSRCLSKSKKPKASRNRIMSKFTKSKRSRPNLPN